MASNSAVKPYPVATAERRKRYAASESQSTTVLLLPAAAQQRQRHEAATRRPRHEQTECDVLLKCLYPVNGTPIPCQLGHALPLKTEAIRTSKSLCCANGELQYIFPVPVLQMVPILRHTAWPHLSREGSQACSFECTAVQRSLTEGGTALHVHSQLLPGIV